jgi:DNA polymerase-1
MRATTKDAMRLFMEGTVALAHVEAAGVRVDLAYLDRAIKDVDLRVREGEARLKQDEVAVAWRRTYGGDMNFTSDAQLGHVLFNVLKHPLADEDRTPTGRPKTDERTLRKVDLPFLRDYFDLKKLRKAQGTYLVNLLRNACGEFVHPSYSLASGGSDEDAKGGARSFRSSCGDPNFQNQPIRNPEIAEMIRRAYVSRPGWQLVEADFSQLEVRASCPYHKDPTLIAYVKDPTTDMHGDTAQELFFLSKKQVVAMRKTARDWSKNRFVFPQFYGSVYFQCAPPLWEACSDPQYKLPGTDTPLVEHLRKHGIKKLGACDPKEKPRPGTFEAHCKKVEDGFWNIRFPVYTRWKRAWWDKYQRLGYFDMLTGFRVANVHKRNDVINYPIQGAAFHCLLWCLIRMDKWLRKNKMRSVIVGEIHDSMLLDVHPKELQDVLHKLHAIMTEELPRAWTWINVPLEAEMEVCPVDGSWYEKREWTVQGGDWKPKERK